MGRLRNSGLAHGTSGSPQTTIDQSTYQNKVEELNNVNKIATTKFGKDDLDYEMSKIKFETYILNLNHSDGRSKAKFFIETLGYSVSNPKQFYDNLSDAIADKKPYKVSKTEFGIVCEFHEKIKCVNGKYEYANIVTSIQKDNWKDKYRIITAYPDKKEKK